MNEFYSYSLKPDEIYHYGIKKRSGRYPWGSGNRPYQSDDGKYEKMEVAKLRTHLDALGKGVARTAIASVAGLSVGLGTQNFIAGMATFDAVVVGLLATPLGKKTVYFKNIQHSAKGSTWEDHKYIKRIDETYYYPDSYEDGRHLSEGENSNKDDNESSATNLSDKDVENLANEVIRGNFGNGQIRKDHLGENYVEVQKRVNELMKTSIGEKKVSEVTSENVKKAEEVAKKVDKSNVHSGVDLDAVLSVYRR